MLSKYNYSNVARQLVYMLPLLGLLLLSSPTIALTSGSMVSGTIDVSGEVDIYPVPLAQGDRYILSVSGDTVFSMQIFAPNGNAVGGISSSVLEGVADQTGTYEIHITNRYSNQIGSYDLHALALPGATEYGTFAGSTEVENTLTAGDLDSGQFYASIGDSVNISVSGTINLRVSLYAPSGNLVASSAGVIESVNLPEDGLYYVVVRSHTAHVTGDYSFYFVHTGGATELGALTSGANYSGSLTAGDLDSTYFNAEIGDSVYLSVSGNITLWLEVYSPSGKNVGQTTGLLELNQLSEAGNYQVVIRSSSVGQTGTYDIHYVRAPSGSEYGAIPSGQFFQGSITPGDLDSAHFDANIGDGVYFSISGNKTMWLEIYSPSGDNIAQTTNYAELNSLAEAGTYTVVVRTYSPHDSADYDIHYVKQRGGPLEFPQLSSGGTVSDTLTSGDLDSTSFSANISDSIYLSVDSSVAVFMEVYAPSGQNIAQSSTVIELNNLSESGDYTVIVRTYAAHAVGDYTLAYVKMPGATEFGALLSGSSTSASLSVGDLDSYHFDAVIGDSIYFSTTGDNNVWLELYSPSGVNIGQTSGLLERHGLTESGTYTAVLRSYTYGQAVNYSVDFVKSPGASEFGLISSGATASALLVPGALDSYHFTADIGDSFYFGVRGDNSVWLELYSPSGINIGQTSSYLEKIHLTEAGNYTLIVRAYTAHQAANYDLHVLKMPGATEYGELLSGSVTNGTLGLNDLDSYSVALVAGEDIELNIVGDNAVWMELYDPNGDNVAQSATLIDLNNVNVTGNYTLIVRNYNAALFGGYTLDLLVSP